MVLVHVIQRCGVDDVIFAFGAQQFHEIDTAFRGGGGKTGETVVANMRAKTVLHLVAGAGRCPAPNHEAASTAVGWSSELRPEMAGDLPREDGRHRCARRQKPALAAIEHRVRLDDDVLNDEVSFSGRNQTGIAAM